MPADEQGVSVPLSLFSGLVTELAGPGIPEGLSPDNQDIVYLPGSVQSRPGAHKILSTPLGVVTVVYQKTYTQPNGAPLNLYLDSAGNLWKEDLIASPGTVSLLTTVPAGAYAQSCSAFGREYIAISDAENGFGIPLQFDGQFVDRVTQDGPGAGPTISNVPPLTATIQATGAPIVLTIDSSPTGIIWTGLQAVGSDVHPTLYYTAFGVTTTTPHGLSAGQQVTIAGSTSTPSVNGTWFIQSISNNNTFRIARYVLYGSQANGGGGTATVTVSAIALSRLSNLVTAVTSAPHNFQPGWQVQISGVSNTNIGGGIASIARDGNGIVTVTTTTAHGLPVGANIQITGVTNPDTSYNGTFTVATVISDTKFTYSQGGTVSTSTLGTGNVQDIWNTTAFIQSVPSTTTFTYQQLGADDSTTNTGTATIVGQVTAGTHNCVVMFLTRQGYLTRPSVPVQFSANGNQQLLITEIPIGPSNVVARVLGFTGAQGGSYFTLLTAPIENGQVVGSSLTINDNTSTTAVIDFSDNALFGGLGIDIPGRNQFAQAVLAPVSGFFGYANRLFTWGERTRVQNFVNIGFDGGYEPATSQGSAGSGTNSGGGTAWTNPANIGSSSVYADVNQPASSTSDNLLAENFGFAISGTPNALTLNIQYYWTGTPGLVLPQLVVQLLKAGIPVGSQQQIFLTPAQGTSATPLAAQVSLSASGLTATDVNDPGFGVQFFVRGGSNGADVFVRGATLSVNTIPPFPLGWSTDGSTSVTGALVEQSYFGFTYQMTSAGGALDCLIQQGAFEDYLGIPILAPNTDYSVRFQAAGSGTIGGNLTIDIFSPTSGQLAAGQLAMSDIGNDGIFRWFTVDLIGTLPTSIPSDTQLRIYQTLVPSGSIITVDELDPFPTKQPYRVNLMRGSYVNAPEQFDLVTGDIGPASDPTPLRSMFEIRGSMYMQTASGNHETQDNATGEPSTWIVREVSQSVGCLSLKGSDPGKLGSGDSGEQWQFTASRGGLYLFWGGETIKVSQEIQPIWNRINFDVQKTIWVKNDVVVRRCYIGVPLDTATSPNVILVLDYRELNDASAIGYTAPFRQASTGRMIASELCRKWTIWNLAANCGEILRRENSQESFCIGAGNGITPGTGGFGNIYFFDEAKLTDDDYGQIVPFYTTYFFINADQEQVLGIDCHRKLATYLTAFISGVGKVQITPLSDTLANAYPQLPAYPLSTSQNHDYEWGMNVPGDRIALKFASAPNTGETDNSFNLQKLCLTLKKEPMAPLRGAI